MSTKPNTIEEFAIENFNWNLRQIESESNLFFDTKKEKIALMINILRNIIESDAMAHKNINNPDYDIEIHFKAKMVYKLELIKAITEM